MCMALSFLGVRGVCLSSQYDRSSLASLARFGVVWRARLTYLLAHVRRREEGLALQTRFGVGTSHGGRP